MTVRRTLPRFIEIALLCGIVTACANQAETSTAPAAASAAAPSQVDAKGLKAAMDAGPITLVDVRTDAEWAQGHAPGAVHIPLDQLEARMSELAGKKAEPVYLICASGGRSSAAQKFLQKQGYTQAINVAGGTNGWRAAGYPVE